MVEVTIKVTGENLAEALSKVSIIDTNSDVPKNIDEKKAKKEIKTESKEEIKEIDFTSIEESFRILVRKDKAEAKNFVTERGARGLSELKDKITSGELDLNEVLKDLKEIG